MMNRNVQYLWKRFRIKNKFIHGSHYNHLVTFTYQLADDVQPEIVNVPGCISNNCYAHCFHVTFFIAKKVTMVRPAIHILVLQLTNQSLCDPKNSLVV